MLRKVRTFPYEIPLSFSPPLALLITEVIIYYKTLKSIGRILLHASISTNCSDWLVWCHILTYTRFSVQLLCKTPSRRLKTLERFKRQTFFHGTTFDLALLQRHPVEVTDECLDVVSLVFQTWVNLLKKCSICKQSEVFVFSCPGDSGAERETGPSRQSSTRPHFVLAASQRLRLRLVPQPSRHTGHTAGHQHTNSHSCTAPWPDKPTAACSGKRPTQRSVCVTGLWVTVWLLTHLR